MLVETQGLVTTPVSAAVRAQITKCYNTTRNVQLTFDDGYSSQANLPSTLAALKAYNVRAQSFPKGSWARSNPGMIRQIWAAGHSLQNHTITHPHLNAISDTAFRSQIAHGQASTTATKLLRPGVAGAYSVQLGTSFGIPVVLLGRGDPRLVPRQRATMVNKVIQGDDRPLAPGRRRDLDTQAAKALPSMRAGTSLAAAHRRGTSARAFRARSPGDHDLRVTKVPCRALHLCCV